MSPEIQRLLEAYRLVDPSLLSVLPAFTVTAFGLVALLADLFGLGTSRGPGPDREGVNIMAPSISVLGVGLGLVAVVWQSRVLDRTGGAYFNGMIVVDGFSVFLSGVVLAGALVTLLLTIGYCRRENIELAEYYHLVLMAAVGMVLMVQAGNLALIFLGLELMSVAVYILTGFRRTRLRSVEGALKYFVLGAFSTGFFVYGIALLYGATGTLDLAAMGAALDSSGSSPLVLAGIGLLIIGFAFKVAMVPFHMWSPDVYEGAPAPITGFMATGVKAAGFAAFARVFVTAFDGLSEAWIPVLWVLAVLTMFVGNIAAIRQDNVKRMLAYSSIAHAGYLAVAMIANNPLGRAAFVYYLAAYTAMTLGAFGVVILLGERGEENTSIRTDYAGIGYRYPILAAAMAVFMFSLTGIPPTAGFVGKFQIISAAVGASQIWLAIFLVVASVISAYYYLRVVVSMYMTTAERAPIEVRPGTLATIGLVICVAAVIVMGVLPGAWIDWARVSLIALR